MLIQWSSHNGNLWHLILRYTEALLLLICLPLLSGTIVGIIRTSPHVNLLCIVVPSFVHILLFYIPARFTLLFFGVTNLTNSLEDNVFIKVASGICVFSINYMCICMFAMFIERCLATKFVQDYEYRRRRYIGYLSLLIIPFSVTLSFAVFIEVTSWKVLGIIDLIAGVIGSFGILLLCNRNRNKFKFVMESPIGYCKYSLSLRYQLNENILTTELVRNIIMVTGLCPALNMAFFILMNLNTERSNIYRDAFYLSIAVETLVMLFAGACASTVLRDALTFRTRKAKCTKQGSKKVTESDRYFRTLNDQWNNVAPKKSVV